MFKRRLINISFLIILLLVSYDVHAQYTVNGGAGTPLLAEQNTKNDIDVYLVYGMNGVEISYTSSSTSHQWYRYKTKALEAETVASQQNGSTSTIRNIEEGYGYFVKETTGFTKYVWIIDYSKYEVELNSLRVSENSGCSWVGFEGDVKMSPIHYYTPLGRQSELLREFELKYNTFEWMEEGRYFNSVSKSVVLNNPFLQGLETPPYTDTDFELRGDLFARHFNVEQSVRSDMYTAVALDVHVYKTILSDKENGEGGGKNEGDFDQRTVSAPVHVVFSAFANEPVANRYAWKIYSKKDSTQFQLNYTGSELDYVFEREGEFIIELTVFDRTGACIYSPEQTQVGISKFSWVIPNAFSPGSSPGINDEFKISYESIVSFKGWIFNRWGVEMFYWTNPDRGWDGKKGGKYVAPGVYFYVLEAKGSDGKTHKETGSINILRPKTERNEIIE